MGGGAADEERALVILLAGTIATQASDGGVRMGRRAVRSLAPALSHRRLRLRVCIGADVGVIAFRWRHANDAEQFRLAFPSYMILGLFAERLSSRIWKLNDGYAALGTAVKGSALAFAPTGELAAGLSQTAARNAAPVGR